MELYCLTGTECLFYKMKRALQRNGGDGVHTWMNVMPLEGGSTFVKLAKMIQSMCSHFTTIFKNNKIRLKRVTQVLQAIAPLTKVGSVPVYTGHND